MEMIYPCEMTAQTVKRDDFKSSPQPYIGGGGKHHRLVADATFRWFNGAKASIGWTDAICCTLAVSGGHQPAVLMIAQPER